MIKQFFINLLSDADNRSSRRFITLIISAHFILTSFLALFVPFKNANIEVIKTILDYDFLIIVSGFGFVTLTTASRLIADAIRSKFLPPNQNPPTPPAE